MTNKQIARALRQTAELIELTGGNAFRARAFDQAARTIDRMEESTIDLLEAGTLTQVQGIGQGLAAQIHELITQGSFTLRDELLRALPPGLLDVLRIKGLGVKKARRLWQELNVTSLEELEQAAETGQLAALDGFGKKSVEQIQQQIRLMRQYLARRRYAEVHDIAEPLLERLRRMPEITRAEFTGELRRKMETIEQVEVLVATDTPGHVRSALATWLPGTSTSTPQDQEPLFAGTLPDGLPIVFYHASPGEFGTRWWWLTGSEAHCEAFVQKYGSPPPVADEAEIYEQAGLPFIYPELRENRGELSEAMFDVLPRLITTDHLLGTLHNHSTYSDGVHTLRQMAEAARKMGYEYFGICDHSQSLAIARGLSIDQVLQQQAEIQELNAHLAQDGEAPFKILSGIESDILADGSLDYPDEILARFDFVVASVHSGFNMTEAEATRRVVRAIENPYTTILGHPTGRLLLSREGYPINHTEVIRACAEYGVAIELNANPYRLDLDWRWIPEATAQGVLISINPDAHSMEELGHVTWGVAVARKGWLTKDHCLNAKPLNAFTSWLQARRTSRLASPTG